MSQHLVTCATCGRGFPSISNIPAEYRQAHGCSAVIYEQNGDLYLHGYYGSRVADMRLYRLPRDRKHVLGNACDDCIKEMLSDGSATLIKEGLW